ncbi:ABC transporter permease [Candidatus Hodarchaeum mangrovi]
MQFRLIWELMKKDWNEAYKSRQVLLMTTIAPFFLGVGLPAFILIIMGSAPLDSSDTELKIFLELLPAITPDWNYISEHAQSLIIFSIFGQLFLLLIPVMIGSYVSTDTIIGEKERQTIEGLFVLPLTDLEILIAKVGVSFIPIMGLTWLMSLFYAVIVDIVLYTHLDRLFLPDIRFILLVICFTPLLGLASILVTVLISSRVSTVRDAQQITGILLIPAMLLVIGQMIILLINTWLIIIGTMILLVFDLITLKISLTFFNRERLVTST